LVGGIVTYTPAANYSGTDSFTYTLSDGMGGSATGTVNVTVNSVNDAPVASNDSKTTAEDAAATIDVLANDTDVDNTAAQLSVKAGSISTPAHGTAALITSGIDAGKILYTPAPNYNGSDSFTYRATDGSADSNVATVDITVTSQNDAPVATGDSYNTDEDLALVVTAASGALANDTDVDGNSLTAVKVTDPSHGSVTLNSNGSFTYTPTANYNGPDSFTYKANDGGLDSNTVTVTLTVKSVNDAPSGANKTVSVNEDATFTFAASDFGFSDPNDTPADALSAVKITQLPGAGSLKLEGVAVTLNQLVSKAAIDANKLTFTPATNASGTGYATLDFRVQDNGGVVNGGVDLDPTSNTVTVDVVTVNDAPAGADKTVSVKEDAAYTLGASDFGFSDVNDSPANSLAAVKITSLPGAGTLKLDGTAVADGALVSAADLAAGKLKYIPAANANGNSYASFTFKVQDDGGVANGGVDLDPTSNTITVNVVSVNDAPAGTDTTVSVDEDGTYTFAASDFGFSDVNDNPANGLDAVRITSIPAAGSLSLHGIAVTAGEVVTRAEVDGVGLR
jgi:VCBS repeat-containing protein